MKEGIHPEDYRYVVFKDMSNEHTFRTRSCAAEKETIKRSNFFLKLADIYIHDLNTLITSIKDVKYNVYDVETTSVKNDQLEHRFIKLESSYTDTLMQEEEFSIISNVHGRPTE